MYSVLIKLLQLCKVAVLCKLVCNIPCSQRIFHSASDGVCCDWYLLKFVLRYFLERQEVWEWSHSSNTNIWILFNVITMENNRLYIWFSRSPHRSHLGKMSIHSSFFLNAHPIQVRMQTVEHHKEVTSLSQVKWQTGINRKTQQKLHLNSTLHKY